MRIFIEPHKDQWPFLVKRVISDDSTIDWRVTEILQRVKDGGDAALINVITEIEGQAPSRLKVTPEEFSEAEKRFLCRGWDCTFRVELLLFFPRY